ncbi:hypothetical protein DSL72_004979 [Monilinia vaccinii-corymbosi]|uniref:Uncharacterized protein n=1 Tax=Monilinia vaccinii-corymbosi TaxID=61207 RepID=A0A8A3PED0_9HELO|nr:hypothetical protein DSL72_004979 [Monilinia vaccinii-corymbosi]
MIAVRDFSYAFNRNHLCRDMILHLILFSRHDDPSFPLGKETKFYTEMLKTTHVSPVREPSTYLQLRREFRRLAPDLEDLDENKAVDEIRRWARLQAHGMLNNMTFEENGTLSSKEESGKEDVNAEVLEAAATLMSMSKQA